MRLLFTTWAWPSHFLPMVPLAWAARADGHEVRFACQPALAATVARSGLPATLVGHDVDLAGPFLREVFPAIDRNPSTVTPAEVRWIGEQSIGLFGAVAEAMAPDLIALVRAWRPDAIVFDPITYAGPLVAAVTGVPAVRHLFGPDVAATEFERPVLARLWRRYGRTDVDPFGILTVDPCPPSLQLPAEVAGRPIRYIPHNGPGLAPRWLCEPPSRRRVCVCWGTSTVRLCGPEHYLAGDMAIAARELDVEVVVAVSAADRELLGPVPPDVRVVQGLPLHLLLPTCDAIVHQGGAGTMLTAAACAVPQMVIPILPDQFLNIFQLEKAGAGVCLYRKGRPGTAVRAEATATLAALLAEPSHRGAADRLCREIGEQDPPSAAVAELAELLR